MTDTSTPILTAVYTALNGVVNCSVYTFEYPDEMDEQMYIVISSPTASRYDAKTNPGANVSFQVDINSWALKYISPLGLNVIASEIYAALKPYPASVLDLAASSMQCVSLGVENDRTATIDDFAGRKYISRQITFIANIHFNN
jgi:hypothetical protein